MRGIYDKLQRLKKDLHSWNHDAFGNIFDILGTAEQKVSSIQHLYEQHPTPELRTQSNEARVSYNKAAQNELRFWEQKARVKWIKGGDVNTKYFHNIVKDRRQRQGITSIYTSDGIHCITEDTIQAEAVSFFTTLFMAELVNGLDALLQMCLVWLLRR